MRLRLTTRRLMVLVAAVGLWHRSHAFAMRAEFFESCQIGCECSFYWTSLNPDQRARAMRRCK